MNYIVNQDRDCIYGVKGEPIFYTVDMRCFYSGEDKSFLTYYNLMLDLSGMTPESEVLVIPAPDYDEDELHGLIATCDSMEECMNLSIYIQDMLASQDVVWVEGYSDYEG